MGRIISNPLQGLVTQNSVFSVYFRFAQDLGAYIKIIYDNHAWCGRPELLMAARALRRTIICITPNRGDLVDHKFYSEIFSPEFLNGGMSHFSSNSMSIITRFLFYKLYYAESTIFWFTNGINNYKS